MSNGLECVVTGLDLEGRDSVNLNIGPVLDDKPVLGIYWRAHNSVMEALKGEDVEHGLDGRAAGRIRRLTQKQIEKWQDDGGLLIRELEDEVNTLRASEPVVGADPKLHQKRIEKQVKALEAMMDAWRRATSLS